MDSKLYTATAIDRPVARDSDYLDGGSLEYLRARHIEILGLEEPEDYEPAERDYDYLDA